MMVSMNYEGTSLDETAKRELDAEARKYASQLLAGRRVRLWRTNNPRCRYLEHAVEWVDASNGTTYGRIGRPARQERVSRPVPWPKDTDADVDWEHDDDPYGV